MLDNSVFSPLMSQLLARRGLNDTQAAEIFLAPDYNSGLHDPMLMMDMDKACARIVAAIRNVERIVIYNDYDCDGIPGGVILHDFFRKIGYENFTNYMPHRFREGYGLNTRAIDEFIDDGAGLIITVDCGITDSEEVLYASERGVEVIITDHHLPIIDAVTGGQMLPQAIAVIDNKRTDCPYPYKDLCGAGTVFKLVQALLAHRYGDSTFRAHFNIPVGWEKWLLDMAGLATIADMVPLVGENRILAHFGLKVLRKSRRPGLQQLFRTMKVTQSRASEDDVGFMVAPRINAASRMSEPSEAFRMLSSADVLEAGALAEELHRLNDQRKGLVAGMVRSANTRLEERSTAVGLREVVVIGDVSWSPGLLGLAANSLMERYERPFFVWGRMGGSTIKGSCRSDGSVNMVALMSAVENGLFLDFGGHAHSGGFSTTAERVHLLEDALNHAFGKVEKIMADQNKGDTVEDARLTLDEVSWDTYRDIAALAPFGIGNPKPLFVFENIEIAGLKRFGRDKGHLELTFYSSNGQLVRAIEFFTKDDADRPLLEQGSRINLLASMECSYFRDKPELRLRIVNIVT